MTTRPTTSRVVSDLPARQGCYPAAASSPSVAAGPGASQRYWTSERTAAV